MASDGRNNMTSEEINIAIHKSRGFTIVSDGITHCLTPCGPKTERDPEGYLLKECPDYVNSLDAMREAEERLDDKQRRDYAFRLLLVLCHGSAIDLSEHFDLLHASARERAEAFLKTLGKWNT